MCAVIPIGELAYQKLHKQVGDILIDCSQDNSKVSLETKLALGKLIWDASERSYFHGVDLIAKMIQGDDTTIKLLRTSLALYNAHSA